MSRVFNFSLPISSKSKLLAEALIYWEVLSLRDYTCYLKSVHKNTTEMIYFDRKVCVADELNYIKVQRAESRGIRSYSIKNRWHSFRAEKESLILEAQKLQNTLEYNTFTYRIIDLLGEKDHPFDPKRSLNKNRRYRLLFKTDPLSMPQFEQYRYVAFKHAGSLKNILLNYDQSFNRKKPVTLEAYLEKTLSNRPHMLELVRQDENIRKCG